MGNGADPSSYEEAINQLQSIQAELEEDVSVLQRAGEDCVDNCGDDPAAQSSAAKVNNCAQQINAEIEKIQEAITGLQAELEKIQAAASKVN